MSDHRDIDAERLAALLDGRLSATEREALLAELAAHDDGAAALGDVAAVLRDLEAGDAIPRDDLRGAPAPNATAGAVGAIRPLRRRTTAWWSGLAAAVIVAAVGVATYRRSADTTDTPSAIVSAFAAPNGRPVGDPWGPTRGAAGTLAPQARAVRFGAAFVALEWAARHADSSTARLSQDVTALLDGAPGGGAVAAAHESLGTADAAEREALWKDAAPLLGADDAMLGAWLAAARGAARARDTSFFHSAISRRATDVLRAPARDDAARRIGAAVRGEIALEWPALERDLDALLARLGG